jgi:hypothetical protein
MVYDASATVRVLAHSDALALTPFLPDIPRVITIGLKSTFTVEKVLSNGSAEIRDRFDAFRIQTQGNRTNGEDRNSQRRIDADLSRQVTGQILTVRYDRNGDLLGFAGAQAALHDLASPTRDVVRLVIRALLTEFGGSGLYPGHPVRPGDTWQRKTVTSLNAVVPASFQIQTTFQYKGHTRYRRANAATVDFHFTDSLKPVGEGDATAGLPSLLKARGVTLVFAVTGGGSGSAVVALSSGRILQKDSTFQENLRASLTGVPAPAGAGSGAAHVDVRTQDTVQISSE